LLVQRRSCRVIALHVGKDAGTRERVGSQDGRVGRGRGKHSLQPRATFDEVPADLPEAPERGGEPQARGRRAWLVFAPLERRSEVVMLDLQAFEPVARLDAPEEFGGRLLRERQVPVAVPPESLRRLTRFEEPIACVLADRLEKPVAALSPGLGTQQRLVDQPRQQVEDVYLRTVLT